MNISHVGGALGRVESLLGNSDVAFGCTRSAKVTSKEPCDAVPNLSIHVTTSFYFTFLHLTTAIFIIRVTFVIIMSFGDRVSDCIAILQLANRIRERFEGAPEEFEAISNESVLLRSHNVWLTAQNYYRMTNLSIVLQDVESALSRQLFADSYKKALAHIFEECHNVLIALEKVVNENSELNLVNVHGSRDRTRRVLKRLTWKSENIQKLRSRINSNAVILNAFIGSVIRYLSEVINKY